MTGSSDFFHTDKLPAAELHHDFVKGGSLAERLDARSGFYWSLTPFENQFAYQLFLHYYGSVDSSHKLYRSGGVLSVASKNNFV